MDKQIKTVAIVQARMNSTRLPGKVLMNLCGKPMLWHIVNRLKQCKGLDDIVVATSINKSDNQIIEFAKRYKIESFRGSEEDVLKRYIDAAERLQADYIVRITADAPLIEPEDIDKMVGLIINKKADFVMAYPNIHCIHEGFSVVSLEALKKIYQLPNVQDYHKEHVTIYFTEHPKFVKVTYFIPDKIFQKAGYKLSVDDKSDFKFIKEIYKRLWDGKSIVDLRQAVMLLEKNPELKSLMQPLNRKKIGKDKKMVVN